MRQPASDTPSTIAPAQQCDHLRIDLAAAAQSAVALARVATAMHLSHAAHDVNTHRVHADVRTVAQRGDAR